MHVDCVLHLPMRIFRLPARSRRSRKVVLPGSSWRQACTACI